LKSEERTSDSDFVFDVIHVSGRMASAKVFILLHHGEDETSITGKKGGLLLEQQVIIEFERAARPLFCHTS
jgi:hypothetical protein